MSAEYDLRTIAISDFRSIRGNVAIALNAPVVLLHGTNGSGKSTVMSALELALTGSVSGVDPPDRGHLVHRGARRAAIDLITLEGAVGFAIEGEGLRGKALLEPDDGRFFRERCYLQQRTLGRLLELYEKPDDVGDSPLTVFVKDLLGLDELDALIDGLYPVTDKRRVKKLVPRYADLDRDLNARRARIRNLQNDLKEAAARSSEARSLLRDQLVSLDAPPDLEGDVGGVASWLKRDAVHEERALVDLVGARRELTALTQRAGRLAKGSHAEALRALEAMAATSRAAAERWRSSHGVPLDALLNELRTVLPGVPTGTGAADPSAIRAAAFEQVDAELDRLRRALATDARARSETERLERAVTAGQRRLTGIDEQLAVSGTATAAEDLGRALAALVPHVHGEDCPVCGRDYSEVSEEPLSARLAARVSDLGARAQHLQELAKARLQALSDLRRAEDERAAVTRRRMEASAKVDVGVAIAQLDDARRRLVEIAPGIAEGAALIRAETEAERDLAVARDQDRTVAELRGALESVAASLGQSSPDFATGLEDGVVALANYVAGRIRSLEDRSAGRAAATDAVAQFTASLKARQRFDREIATEQAVVLGEARAIHELERRRAVIRKVREEAESARGRVVRRVFTNSLNRAWRDLFVRLAPEEPFVPVFRLPDASEGVVVTLETMHRDGKPGGPPAAMLSAGNLNTAALTLFLALNLSVHRRLPWLLLDDPVQSMDEVHVAQFAALLRTLAREHGRRVVIAVHERSLFEYLALELSPANPDEGLITVELSRSPDGSTSVHSSFQAHVEDRALEPA